jgi:DNA-binding CsgD family transcriptional regulator/tetratricopeptide (TPR) repeat protein
VLYGRDAERSALQGLLNEARASRSGTLVLRGSPGVGKSALLDDAVSRADGMRILRTRGIESESELPFAAVHQLLRPVWGHIEHLPAPQATALRVAFGYEFGDHDGRPGERFLISLAVLSLLAEASEQTPVLCVVDDAHWLDEPSAQTLIFVARRLEAEQVALLLAARDGEVGALDTSGLPELPVGDLSVAAATDLIAERAGAAVTPEVCRWLVERTGGNPLALIELPPALRPEQLRGAEPLPMSLPLTRGVERAFLDRVNRLPAAVRMLLAVAAADDTGRQAVVRAAAATLGIASEALGLAERSGLLRVDGPEIEFRHPLVRSAVYQGATTQDRQDAHGALARTLAAAGDQDRYAWHRAAATAQPDESAAAALDAAAQRSAARGALESACSALERAAELSPDLLDRVRRLVAAADYAWLAGNVGRASRLLGTARPLASEPVLRADVARLSGCVELAVGSAPEALRLLFKAAQDIAPVDAERALDALVVAAEAASYAADVPAVVEIGRLAGRLQQDGNPHNRFRVCLLTGFGHHFAGDTALATPPLRTAIALAEEHSEADPLAAAGRAAMYVGDDEASHRLTGRSVALARDAGAVGHVVSCLQRLALVEIVTGRWSAAHASATEALRLARETGQPELSGLGAVWLALLAALKGEEEEFQSWQAVTEEVTTRHPIRLAVDELNWARGVHELASGQFAPAVAKFGTIKHPVVARLASLDAIEAVTQAGQPELVGPWLRPLTNFARDTSAPWALARVSHACAVVDRDSAVRHFEAALGHHAVSGRPFERGRTCLAYGEFLRRARHRVDARPHLRAAVDVFDSLGAGPWAERARLELRASGETARRRNPSTLLRLTPQETQVARFAARGLSTREVAAQLFLSPRTVDYHLRNVFTKAGITSRAALSHLSLDQ